MYFGCLYSNMHGIIKRNLEEKIIDQLTFFPVVAILGPRQSGKSTLAKELAGKINNFLYLDLESISDLNKLNDVELFFSNNKDKTICLDEIQRKPEIFPVIRSIIDKDRRPGKLIVLGSASGDLLKQSFESLAGRIAYNALTPFTITEIESLKEFSLNEFWLRGGFPSSYLAPNSDLSIQWRDNFIKTFFEQDIPQLGIKVPSLTLRHFFQLCAHTTGQVSNMSKLGEILNVTHHAVKRYMELLEHTFIIRLLPPYYKNIKKRILKSPKIYLRDSGLLHTLLGIPDFNNLLGHPSLGQSWEAFALENILSELNDWNEYYFRTSNGAEIDLILEKGLEKIAIEFKASTSPKIKPGSFANLEMLGIKDLWIVAPIEGMYELKKSIHVTGLLEFINTMKKYYH